jgi:hypothetical protein
MLAQEFIKVGKLEKQKAFGQDLQIKLKPGTDPANIRIIAFVQEAGLERILGTALQKITSESVKAHVVQFDRTLPHNQRLICAVEVQIPTPGGKLFAPLKPGTRLQDGSTTEETNVAHKRRSSQFHRRDFAGNDQVSRMDR